MSDIKLSVIIPAYNAGDFVSGAVDSVRKAYEYAGEKTQPVEILIIDDGSTDGSGELIDDIVIKKTDGGCVVRAIHQENRGHGGAINAGMDAASGEYVMVLDADDSVYINGFKDLFEALESQSPDLLICGEDRWYEDSDKRENYRVPGDLLDPGSGSRLCDMQFVTDNWNTGLRALFNMHCMVYRTAFFKALNIRLPEKVYYDDAYYYVVAASHAVSIVLLDGVLYEYRLGNPNQSVSADNRVKRIAQLETVIDAILDEYEMLEKKGGAGFLYYRLRLSSVVSDHLVTALLRGGDRAAGRRRARLMKDKLKGRDIPKLKRNYFVLYCMNLMHMGEKQFDRLILKK